MGTTRAPLRIEYVPVADLRKAAYNPRRISEQQLAALQKSLAAWGFVDPVIARREDNEVIGGHQRIDAAEKLGLTEVPVVFLEGLTEHESQALNLALNKISGEWEEGRLQQLVLNLHDVPALDLEATGFTLPEISRLVTSARGDDPRADAVPEPPEEPITQPGDLWKLGDHRLLCGDATKPDDVARLMDGGKPLLCVTDPPYGVEYDPAWRNEAAAKGQLAYAARRIGEVPNDDRADWSDTWGLFPGDVIYSWHPPGATSLVHAAALQGSGFAIRMQIIWAKRNFPVGRGDYHVRHEPCWYAVRDGRPAHRTTDRTQTTLWEITLDRNVPGGHSTQKPVECMARPIRNHEFEEVYDPFLGSGTTLIACEKLGRRCYAMEIEPRYVDVAVRRWEAYTGQKAHRA